MSLTHSHTPFRFSFHSVTLPSPQLTARILPARDQETRQTTSGNLPGVEPVDVGDDAPEADGSSAVFTQGEVGVSFVQMRTVLSWWDTISTCVAQVWERSHLRSRRYVAPRETDIRGPSDIPNPVSVTLEDLFFDPGLRVFPVSPNFDEIVAARTCKTLDVLCGGLSGG